MQARSARLDDALLTQACGWDHRTSQHQVLRNDLDGVNLGAVPAFTQLVGIETPIAEQSPWTQPP